MGLLFLCQNSIYRLYMINVLVTQIYSLEVCIMKKLFWKFIGFIALVLVLILFLEFAFAAQDEVDRLEFQETIKKLEASYKTYAVLQLSAGQVVFVGEHSVHTVAFATDVSDAYIGRIALGSVTENRFSVAFEDGNRYTVYITDGVDQVMEIRFPVFVE